MTSREKTKVLYIAGSGRSGSTILDNILGQIEGFFPVGEFVYVWNRLANDGICSCGSRFRACELWGPVLERVLGNAEDVDARAMLRIQKTSTRPRHIPLKRRTWARSCCVRGGRRSTEMLWGASTGRSRTLPGAG